MDWRHMKSLFTPFIYPFIIAWIMSVLAVSYCKVNIYIADFIYLFCRRISGWSSFWRMSRSLAKSWRELSERYPSRRTTVLGTTAATDRIGWPAGIFCVVPVHVSAALVVGQEQSGAPIPLFCPALRLHISLTHSSQAPLTWVRHS